MNAHSKVEIPDQVKSRWWWRRLVFVEFDEETHTTRWKRHVTELPNYYFSNEWGMWQKDELAAFRYELLRRVSFKKLPEWPLLPVWKLSFVSGVLSPKPERAIRGLFHPRAPEYYASLGSWMWDLKASDESLCKHFLLQINEERRKVGLPDTGDPFYGWNGAEPSVTEKRRGKRNRPVSWLAVEAHDLQEWKIRPLTDGERSRLSKARRELSAFKAPLEDALAEAERVFAKNQRDRSPGSIYFRFIREHFLARMASQLPKK